MRQVGLILTARGAGGGANVFDLVEVEGVP
jgi:hypothetical protein